jgi:hypothetical protein
MTYNPRSDLLSVQFCDIIQDVCMDIEIPCVKCPVFHNNLKEKNISSKVNWIKKDRNKTYKPHKYRRTSNER